MKSAKSSKTLLVAVAAIAAIFAAEQNVFGKKQSEDDDFDRLDGTGPSGCKVDAIEWKKNLEFHIYPMGCMATLGFKVDDKNQDKPVLVVEYKPSNGQKKFVKRVLIGDADVKGKFKVYEDKSAHVAKKPYDKFIVSKQDFAKSKDVIISKRVGDEPKVLYPEGHPAIAEKNEKRTPSSGAVPESQSTGGTAAKQVDENGSIGSFDF